MGMAYAFMITTMPPCHDSGYSELQAVAAFCMPHVTISHERPKFSFAICMHTQ